MELTPIYAIEPLGSFSGEVYAALQELLSGQVQAEDSPEYIQRRQYSGADYWTHSTPVLRTSGSRH
ncbi:MAG UNVERIFIED_CONTAM: hypothetical protein LVR29_00885 [Microcystis novacekii LVE1205-3]